MQTKLSLVIVLVVIIILRVQISGGLRADKVEPGGIVDYFSHIGEIIGLRTENILPQPQSALLSGMVIGVKSSLPKDFKKALERTGTIHIVVVSGQNLTLLAGFIMNLAAFIGRKKTLALTLGVLFLYCLLTGFQIPVIRAALMFVFVSIAQFFNREGDTPWILSLTALLMLVYNPNWILSISFQLSFLATAGVVMVAPVFIERFKFLPNIIKEDFSVSLAAFLMTLPIIAINFHRISLLGVLVNIFVLWTVPIIMISGALAMLIFLINPLLGSFIALFPGAFLTYFVYIIEFFDFEWTSVYIPRFDPIIWIGYFILLAGVILGLKSRLVKEST